WIQRREQLQMVELFVDGPLRAFDLLRDHLHPALTGLVYDVAVDPAQIVVHALEVGMEARNPLVDRRELPRHQFQSGLDRFARVTTAKEAEEPRYRHTAQGGCGPFADRSE